VGLSVVQGAVMAKAGRIIAVDTNSDKFELARQLGATDCVNPEEVGDVVEAIVEMTDGGGLAVLIEQQEPERAMRRQLEPRALNHRIQGIGKQFEDALDGDNLRTTLPSALAGDEVGDLSRSFSHVLRQLGEYNDYLRSLASKLSHELRTPLAIVTSSLENLEHEPLNSASADYAARAKGGADRLRRILTAMSEASRVEELMQHAEPEEFDLCKVLESTAAAYRDVYPKRTFELTGNVDDAVTQGSPELLIQMLDKLVDNAVDFSGEHDVITIGLSAEDSSLLLTISNPGPKLPEQMRSQLFDSMVSVRPGAGDKHLGLGLYIAKLIAEGHGGKIQADNTDVGVRFTVTLPRVP